MDGLLLPNTRVRYSVSLLVWHNHILILPRLGSYTHLKKKPCVLIFDREHVLLNIRIQT